MRGQVVPYVGTWIEIGLRYASWNRSSVVPYVGTWIEIAQLICLSMSVSCRSLRGNVDRNNEINPVLLLHLLRRSLRGNVDRNSSGLTASMMSRVVPYVGTWIEIIIL